MLGRMGQDAILNKRVNLGDIEKLFEQRWERDYVSHEESRATTLQAKESASANALRKELGWRVLGRAIRTV